MATTTFNTRISLKYDTYANWVEKDPVLLAGELAVVVVPAATGAVAKEPAILFKAGDGSSKVQPAAVCRWSGCRCVRLGKG